MTGLINTLEQQLQESDVSRSDVGDQIERNYRYYSLQPLGNEQPGRSHYISPDVLDAVESKKALFRQTFLSNRQAVKFSCSTYADPMEADAKTAYANAALGRNHKDKLFSDAWHDAFLAKRCVAYVEWKEETSPTSFMVSQPIPEQELYALISEQYESVAYVDTTQMQVQMMQGMQGPITLLSGPVTVHEDESFAKITLVRPERYYRDPQVADVQDGMWATVEDDVPRGTLKDDGYDPEQVDGLEVDYRWRTDEVEYARKAHDKSGTRHRQYRRTDGQSTVTVYKTWTWLDMAEDGAEYGEFEEGLKLYEIHWAGGEVLRWQDGTPAIREVDKMRVHEWSELRIAHAENGMCEADVTSHTQKVQSTLKRLIIDNQQMRNTSRYEAVQDALKNPRDLLDNRIGGVVWSTQIGSVAPLATPELSPLTLNVIQMLNEDGEKRSGLSALGKGMNADAIRYQNAADMVDRLTNAGTIRPMQAARDWAWNWLIPICKDIVELGMENDQGQTQVEMSGRMVVVAPQQWQDYELDMEVSVALTPKEAEEHAQKLMMMHTVISQDPQLSTLYGVKERHALFDDIFDAMGVADTTKYLMRPDSEEYMQAMQQQAEQAQMEQMAQQQMMQQQIDIALDEQARKWADLNNKIDDTLADNERADEEFAWDMFKDSKEIEIEEEQQRQASIG